MAKRAKSDKKAVKPKLKLKDSSVERVESPLPRESAVTVTVPVVYNQDDVIRIILDVAGKYEVPTSSQNIKKKKLYDNLGYTDDLLDNLQIELDRYVKTIKRTAEISDDDLATCDTVGDVIDLVEKQLRIT